MLGEWRSPFACSSTAGPTSYCGTCGRDWRTRASPRWRPTRIAATTPHLSYVVLRSWDLARAQQALSVLPAAEPFTMSFHGTLAFPRGRAALAPAVTADMALRQWRIVTALTATGAELHRNYEAGQWVPHVSVATRAQGAQLATVVKAIADVLPLTVRVNRAAIVDSATGQTWPLPHIL
jgi:2'-5' RNA ligase